MYIHYIYSTESESENCLQQLFKKYSEKKHRGIAGLRRSIPDYMFLTRNLFFVTVLKAP